ncbi:MAG: AAA family ATPase [Pirellulales bacterium]
MATFSRLHVQGFRRLADVDIELRPLCVAIGANGCGKTSLLDVFSLLSASARAEFAKSIGDLGGFSSVNTRDSEGVLEFVASLTIPWGSTGLAKRRVDRYDYRLSLKQQGMGYAIEGESLVRNAIGIAESQELIRSIRSNVEYLDDAMNVGKAPGSKTKKPTYIRADSLFHNPLETALSQVTRQPSELGHVRNSLEAYTYYSALPVAPRSPVRLPQVIRPASLPGKDGEELVSCLVNLRETDRGRFETVEDTLKAAFNSFERLDFPPVAAGTLAMTWKDKNFSRPFYMHELGEGMLRFLWLVTLLQSPGLTAITLIDEPEVSLHPELLALLADLFREASARTQLIVATHSDRLVRFLEPKEVLAFDVAEDGTTTAKWADEHDLDRWLADYTLDEVWRMGRIGGRS